MKGVFGYLYSGKVPVEDVNVSDIITVSVAPELQEESDSITDAGIGQLNPQVRARIDARKDWFFKRDGAQPPVTEEEATEISRQVEEAKLEMQAVENRITSLQAAIEIQIHAQSVDGQEAAIFLDTKGHAALKRALRKLFGRDMTRITLSDMKELLAARTAMEQEAVLDYAQDFPGGA